MELLRSLTQSDLQPFLADPTQLNTQRVAFQLAVASYSQTPRHLLEVLVNSPHAKVAEDAQLHVNWAGEMSEDGQNAVEELLKSRYLGQNDRLAVELLKIAPVPPFFLSQWVPSQHLIQALSNPYLPPRYRLKLLERLAKEPSLEPRLQVAETPETPLAVLESLVGDLELAIRVAVQHNPSCPPELVRLVQGQHEIASDWDTDAQQLATLAQSRWDWIRLAVAQNPSTSEETLLKLAEDKVFKIQLAVAKNPVTPASVLSVLAEHSEKEIQAAVAVHPNATEEILHRLYPTQQGVIRNCQNLPASILERFFNQRDENTPLWKNNNLIYFLLQQPNTPTWILAEFAKIDIEKLTAEKLELEQRAGSTPGIHKTWVNDEISFLVDVAKHPQVSVEILESLSQSPNPNVQLAAKGKPKFNLDLIIQQRTTLGEILEKIIDETENYQKSNIAKHPNVFRRTLEKLAEDSSPKVRLAVAQNPYILNSLKTRLLEVLATDKLETIRAAVAGWSKTPIHLLEQIGANILSKSKPDTLVCAALIGNINTPVNLKTQIIEYLNPDKLDGYKDLELCIAIKLNHNLPIVQKIQQNKQFSNIRLRGIDTLAKDISTPIYLLEQIAALGTENRLLAENPCTPVDILKQLARQPVEKTINNVSTVRETVLKNPNLPTLERYRLLFEKEQEQELEKANQILASRTDSPYALAQVVETGDLNAKISAVRNRKTPIQVLEQLAKDSDVTIRQVVAQNPNLPLNSLLELAQDSSVHVRLSLVYKSSHSKIRTPVQLLEQLAQDESEQVRAKVAEHPNTPVEILIQLANDSSLEVKKKLTENLNTPVTVLNRLGLEENIFNQRNPNTPPEVLAQAVNRLLSHPYQKDPRWKDLESTNKPLVEILKHPVKGSQMPPETLAQLASHHSNSVRYRVAAHPNTPTYALEQLARDSYIATLRAVVDNPNTPPHVLKVLANTPDVTTRLSIARNSNTPVQTLAQMVYACQTSGNAPARTKDMLKSAFPGDANDVLRALASNPRTPIEALGILARREFVSPTPDPKSILPPRTADEVIRSLVYNPSLTPELLTTLTFDPDVNVRIALVRHPNLTETHWRQLAEDEALAVREAVAISSIVPIHILEILSIDEQAQVRSKVATNPRTSVSVLEALVRDEDAAVRTAIATNPNLPPGQLEQLAQDEKVEVRRAVAQNPNTPDAVRASLQDLVNQPTTRQTSPTLRSLSRIYNPNTDDLALLLTEYAQSDNEFVRFVTLLHPVTPVEVLQQAAQSASWLERYAVADNPATPTEIKQQLAQDSNQIVRAIAYS